MQTSKRLSIFEGPDGSGKSTAAKRYAETTGAKYVHFPALSGITSGLARMYVEAMLPAVLGYQDVVLDRCWLSEGPYGAVFREGQDRLGGATVRMLERLALRCKTALIMCNPGLEAVMASFKRRKGAEMLANTSQLCEVYQLYTQVVSALPRTDFDFNKDSIIDVLQDRLFPTSTPHPLAWQTAGSYYAKTIVVGEGFAARKNQDPWYQWPFASFSDLGCSQWLTDQLTRGEEHYFWINADQDLSLIKEKFWTTDKGYDEGARAHRVIALGSVATDRLRETCGDAIHVIKLPHPQYHKRFSTKYVYDAKGLL